MLPKSKEKTKSSDVANFLTSTGFIFEMEVAEFLKNNNYQVMVNQKFLDLEKNKKRDIDIIAIKEINKILIHLIIECKQSLYKDWIFICSDKESPRYYYAVKHFPLIRDLRKSSIFDALHNFDRSIPLAQNYIAFHKRKGKKTSGKQIDECLFKLPKALLQVASNASSKVKNVFFPIGLFSGQMFIVNYNKKLLVKEKKLITYSIDFESRFYKPKKENINQNRLTDESFHYDPDEELEKTEINGITETAKLLGKRYQIDFINRTGLGEYLNLIEKEICKISSKKWTFNTVKRLKTKV
ncbi:MAG: hypothetical protein Q8N59_01225 [bacterium]|nr:hypothetical protein [bacterium]